MLTYFANQAVHLCMLLWPRSCLKQPFSNWSTNFNEIKVKELSRKAEDIPPVTEDNVNEWLQPSAADDDRQRIATACSLPLHAKRRRVVMRLLVMPFKIAYPLVLTKTESIMYDDRTALSKYSPSILERSSDHLLYYNTWCSTTTTKNGRNKSFCWTLNERNSSLVSVASS